LSALLVEVKKFEEWPKIARLSRNCVITEKIDGTNASIYIPEIPGEAGDRPFLVGSRTRWITPENDNYGFARWAYDHADELLQLGPGHHFGEWWGSGCQRGYGLPKGEKRFSLFNGARWSDDRDRIKFPIDRPACCYVVPTLYSGVFTTTAVEIEIERLRSEGSKAAPGFMNPEGVVVYHEAARAMFKKTLEKDSEPKGLAR
jgi:hypothetical protein